MPFAISSNDLEEVVADAIDALPDEILEKMENLAVIVRDEPDDDVLDDTVRDEGLGEVLSIMYSAGSTRSPQTLPSAYLGHRAVRPDILAVFRKMLEEECNSREELVETVERGIRRELGRYFGLSEERLEELGWA